MSVSSSTYLPAASSLDKQLIKYVKKSDLSSNIVTQAIGANTITVNSLSSSSNPGSIASNNLGSGATVSISSISNNLYGQFSFSSGSNASSTSAGTLLLTISFASSFASSSSYIVFLQAISGNGNTLRFYAVPLSASSFGVYCSSALSNSVNYGSFIYHTFGN